ncbi:glucose dehydrogenase [FAD, quinone] [Folsomia candida]|uniref:glucose dehydrogenase [FAD, quinone] n=1 Tax=Folsomia candida TaxID=158441 RepID=UPI000B904A02|nr:glucose dehydrogenase [FAD, quinone] [Folsomia candida]
MKLPAFVFGTVPLMVSFYARKYIEEDKAQTLTELENDFGIPRIKKYDFIVVGGGSAGCIVTGRLSERFNVLLLEAGGKPVPLAHVPIFTREVAVDPDTNYLYKSVPQRNMSLVNGGVVGIETGKMLGGSGSHNDMGHQRGSPHDWNYYASVTGDPSWRYENVLPFFKKSEDFVGFLLQPEQAEYYGQGGPLTVDTHMPAFFPIWADAGRELGYPVADPNALQIPSFAPFQKLIDKGGRVSTYNRYVLPYEGTRANLTVIRYATVTQILLDKDNTAYGVAFLRHGIPQIAHATNEVVLSAGAINSPLILMMSGIGPRDQLEAAEIPVKVDRPFVGQNLADHIHVFFGSFSFNSSAIPYLPFVPEEDLEAALTEYLETGLGEFGELQESPQAFFSSSRAVAEGEGHWPDGRISIDVACPISFSAEESLTKVCFVSELDRPKSRGSVTLNSSAFLSGSTDFVQLANVDFNGLGIPSDLDVILDGIELIFKVVEETESFASLGARYDGTQIQGCEEYLFRSREYWACYTQQLVTTAIHMVGTCGMGSEASSVTDSKLRVRGVTGLRVVDASVLPTTPNANLNGPVILVAEKAAADIASDW